MFIVMPIAPTGNSFFVACSSNFTAALVFKPLNVFIFTNYRRCISCHQQHLEAEFRL